MSRSCHAGRAQRAFTLAELLVVMAIIAVLAGIAWPVTSRVIGYGRAASCLGNLRNIGAALNLYLGEHSEIMPTLQAARQSTADNVPVIDNTLNAYLHDLQVFACPADNQGIAANTGTSYYWNSVLNGQSAAHLQFLLTNGLNAEIPVLSDKQGFHPYAANKVNILYADGHASQDLTFVTSQ
jgi:prepilin-type N-terminal cleavage/methylation domain-containing protein/prepilin-type processing-associated H-X9-DG protein